MANAVETLEKLERRLTITISVEEVKAEVDKRLKVRARTAKAPGFRQGKVPMKMVTAQYGPQIENDILNEKVSKAFADAAKENNLKVAGYPRFEEKKEDVPEGMLAFSALFEVYPEVRLGSLEELELEKTVTDVTEEDVGKTLDIMRKRQAHFHTKGEHSDHGDGGSDVTAQDGDRVTVDFIGRIDGVEFDGGKADDFVFMIGEKQMLPEFEDAARGMKKGESKTFNLAFPADYHGKDVAGKTAEFTITMKNVEWAHLPEINEDFAKSLGIAEGSVERMYQEIESNLKREVKNRLDAVNKNRVLDALVSISKFDLPQSLVNREMHQIMESTRRDLASRNLDMPDAPLPPEMFAGQAEKRVRLGLIFANFMQSDDIKVTDDDLKARAEEIGSSYEDPKVVVDYYMSVPERRQELEALVMEDKVIDYIYGKAKTVEKAMPFEQLMTHQI